MYPNKRQLQTRRIQYKQIRHKTPPSKATIPGKAAAFS